MKDGGPAFPLQTTVASGQGGTISLNQGHMPMQHGMSLRDYFAAKAMATILNHNYAFIDVARDAYEVADAMLAARTTESER